MKCYLANVQLSNFSMCALSIVMVKADTIKPNLSVK